MWPAASCSAGMFELKAIVSDAFRDGPLSTVQALVLETGDRTQLTGIISFLGERLPMAAMSLQHLKRIDSKRTRTNDAFRVLVCRASTEHQIDHLEPDVREFLLGYGRENLSLCRVPDTAPLTRSQYREASSLWPVNFHEDKYVAGCLTGSLFGEGSRNRICQLMQQTLDAAGDCQTGTATVVRHEARHVVTQVASSRRHPLHHAAMVAIDQVAQIHEREKGRGAPDYQEDYLCTNYECFLSYEPCMMCAMALVHSRIKRVFFFAQPSRPDPGHCPNDGPYTVHGLHHNPSLNHRYEVWQLTSSASGFPNKRLKCR